MILKTLIRVPYPVRAALSLRLRRSSLVEVEARFPAGGTNLGCLSCPFRGSADAAPNGRHGRKSWYVTVELVGSD